MVKYVTDTSHWEDWQREYRLGLILILPPDDIGKQVEQGRAGVNPYVICRLNSGWVVLRTGDLVRNSIGRRTEPEKSVSTGNLSAPLHVYI